MSVLEFACGSANRFFDKYGIAKLLDCTDVDLNDNNIANARGRFPDVNFEVQSILDLLDPLLEGQDRGRQEANDVLFQAFSDNPEFRQLMVVQARQEGLQRTYARERPRTRTEECGVAAGRLGVS